MCKNVTQLHQYVDLEMHQQQHIVNEGGCA